MRRFAWLQTILAAYVWLVFWIPLGDWNRQSGERMLPALVQGHGLESADLLTLAFVTFPAILAWLAYRRSSLWLVAGVLGFNLFWGALQIQSWWIPYVLGTDVEWQLKYAEGPTTKVLPSFPGHPAPDGMHLVIHVLLVCALVVGSLGIRQRRIANRT